MNVLGLFSGIGGFELGFQRAGFNIAAMCDNEPFCQAVLRKHFPGVPIYADVHDITAARLAADGVEVDVVTGGFPCQDISLAGKGAGLTGARSGLWYEYHRIIDEVRPTWAVIENVSALRARGLDAVLGSLAAIGYDAEWHCIPAAAVGAPHRRDRVWIVAHAARLQPGRPVERAERERIGAGGESITESVADPDGVSRAVGRETGHMVGATRASEGDGQQRERRGDAVDDSGSTVADAQQQRLEGRTDIAGYLADQLAAIERSRQVSMADTSGESDGRGPRAGRRIGGEGDGPQERGRGYGETNVQWLVEPNVGRVANGVPARVDRLRALGNAVVPQIPEIIGRAILEAEGMK